jgi:hypothetical protein
VSREEELFAQRTVHLWDNAERERVLD